MSILAYFLARFRGSWTRCVTHWAVSLASWNHISRHTLSRPWTIQKDGMLLYMVRLSSKDRRPSSLSLPLYEVALRPDNPPLDPSQAAPCQLLSRVTRLQWHTPHVVEHIACRVSQKFSHFCSGMSDRSVTTYLTLLREQHFCPGRQYRSWRLGDQAKHWPLLDSWDDTWPVETLAIENCPLSPMQ